MDKRQSISLSVVNDQEFECVLRYITANRRRQQAQTTGDYEKATKQ